MDTSNHELYEEAQAAWQRGELNAAFRLFRDAAESGDKRAYRELAQFYDLGEGTSRDEDRALYWYRKAYAECLDASAAHNFACIVRDKGEIDRALWWFWRAVRLGDDEAYLEIAKVRLKRGDRRKAERHLRTLLGSQQVLTEASRDEAVALLAAITESGE